MQSLDHIFEQAKGGDADAQFFLGSLYDEGFGVPQSYRNSMHWLRKAAAQGHAAAQCSIGFNYVAGLGLSRNYAKATVWFRKAAEQNNSKALFNLGLMSLKGQGLSQNLTDAVAWFRKAAAQGHVDAQLMLRILNQNREIGREASDRNPAIVQSGAFKQDGAKGGPPQNQFDPIRDRDALTGMLNRSALLKTLQSEIDRVSASKKAAAAQIGGLCIVLIEVDQLKQEDDEIGPANRDAILRGLGDRLSENLRRSDIVGRIGVAEFAVCMRTVALRDATASMERFRSAIAAAPFETPSGPRAVAVRMGVAAFKDGDSVARLLQRASAAMHAPTDEAKERTSRKRIPNH